MSMNISQSMLPEFDMEIANTRKTLERVPEGNPDFRPHPKSMAMGRLAGHLVEIPMWALMTLGQDEFDMNPAGGSALYGVRHGLAGGRAREIRRGRRRRRAPCSRRRPTRR